MIYFGIRLVLSILFIGLVLFILKKAHKKINVLSALLLIVMCVIIFIIPFEYPLLKFDSPEQAFQYSHTSHIQHVINYDNSSLVFYGNDGSSISCTYVNKTNSSWLMANPVASFFRTIKVEIINSHAYTVDVLHNKSRNELYVVILNGNQKINAEEVMVTDSLNSEFVSFSIPYQKVDYKTTVYCTKISEDIQNYSLYINGEELKLNNTTA